MAERRMFSKRVVNTARFIKMPLSSQCLYFHLCLNADDDGVVEAFSVMRSVGCAEDDLRVLVTKEFVKVLNEDLVTYILDWTENNHIRPDRKIDSIYQPLLLEILPNTQLVEPKERADKKKKEVVVDNQWTTNGQPTDSTGKVSLGKVSLEQDRLEQVSLEQDSVESNEKRKRFTPPTLDEVKAFIRENNYTVNADRWFDYYSANGWKVGKNPMKDWKASVRYWNKDQKPAAKNSDQAFIDEWTDVMQKVRVKDDENGYNGVFD